MKRFYRVRIILGAMLSFAAASLIMVAGIWLHSYMQMERETDQFIAYRLQARGSEGPPYAQQMPFPMFGYSPSARRYPSGFYEIELDGEGKALSVTPRGMAEEGTPQLQEMAEGLFRQGQAAGKAGSYKYGVRRGEDGGGRMILMDISIQLYSLYRVLRASVYVALGMMTAVFLILLPVSGRLAAVFVRNAEKQKQFITDAGHDLKTPVAISRANLDVLELTQGKNKWSGNIRAQMDRMEKLISQLVMMARLDENSGNLLRERLNLSQVLREVWQEYGEAMEGKRAAASADIAPGLETAGAEDALRQMVRLLLDNAVQYTPEGGTICLTARPERKKIRVRVSNTVSSLPTLKPEELTGRFVRGDTARTQKTAGAGIGLSAVRRICEMHRGTLKISYEEGSVFCACAELPVLGPSAQDGMLFSRRGKKMAAV